jgi:hypothetical protein
LTITYETHTHTQNTYIYTYNTIYKYYISRKISLAVLCTLLFVFYAHPRPPCKVLPFPALFMWFYLSLFLCVCVWCVYNPCCLGAVQQ